MNNSLEEEWGWGEAGGIHCYTVSYCSSSIASNLLAKEGDSSDE